MANQPDTVVVDKLQKKAVGTDVTISSNSNIQKKQKKFKKYQGLKEEDEKVWEVKATLVLMVKGALWKVTPQRGRVASIDPKNNIRNLCPDLGLLFLSRKEQS